MAEQCGDIIVSWCSCTAGYVTTCNHVIAVLYKVEYAISNNFNQPSCTEVSCEWNSGTHKEVKPMRVANMDIRTDSTSSKSTGDRQQASAFKGQFDPRRSCEREISSGDISTFLKGLGTVAPTAVIFTGFAHQLGSQQPSSLPPTIQETADMFAAQFSHREQEAVKELCE